MKLSKDPFFISTFGIGSIITVGSAIAIGFSGIGALDVCFKPECFTNFLTYYAFPFKAATATAAILGIVAMLHKSKQTAEQIALSTQQIQTTINQNQYLNYSSHLKDFREQINGLELKVLKIQPSNTIYKLIFPKNSPKNFNHVGYTIDLNDFLCDFTRTFKELHDTVAVEQVKIFLAKDAKITSDEDFVYLRDKHNEVIYSYSQLLVILGLSFKENAPFIMNNNTNKISIPNINTYHNLKDDINLITNKLVELSYARDIERTDIESSMMGIAVFLTTCNKLLSDRIKTNNIESLNKIVIEY